MPDSTPDPNAIAMHESGQKNSSAGHISHKQTNSHGEILYSITGESNAGDSRPASAKPNFHYVTNKLDFLK